MSDTMIVVCQQCFTQLRVPNNKGKIMVTCPNCHERFLYIGTITPPPPPFTHTPQSNHAATDLKKKKPSVIEKIRSSVKSFFRSLDRRVVPTIIVFSVMACIFGLAIYFGQNHQSATVSPHSSCSHNWIAATCTTPQTCSKCGAHIGSVGEHSWITATATTPKTCSVCGKMLPMSLPANGQVFTDIFSYKESELTIHSSSHTSCFIKLKDASNTTVLSFFVQPNRSLTISVPDGYYRVFFAYGDDWYGPDYCFGDDTYYGKDDNLLDFYNYTYEYTLYPVENGNFKETPISADEF